MELLYDSKAKIGSIPAVLPQEEFADRQAKEPRNVPHAQSCRSPRTSGPILQARRIKGKFQDASAGCPSERPSREECADPIPAPLQPTSGLLTQASHGPTLSILSASSKINTWN